MRILIVAPSTRAIAESAKKAKYNFATIDFFGDIDQKEICENYSLREEKLEYTIENLFKYSLSKSKDFTHIVYGSGFENYPELIEKYERNFFLLGNPAKIVKEVRDWWNFFKTLKKLGIAYPETEIIKAEELKEIQGKYIVKPLKTGGGKRISFLNNIEEKDEKLLLQEFIEGKNVSSCIVGNFFIGGSEQLLHNFKYLGNIAPFETEELKEASIKIAETFKLIGVNGIDFVISESNELYAIEVNPRITGAMEVLEKAYGINLFDLHVKSCLGEEIDINIKRKNRFFGKKILYAHERVEFKAERTSFIKDIPKKGEIIEKNSPICTVIGEGSSMQECLKDLEEKEKIIYKNLRVS